MNPDGSTDYLNKDFERNPFFLKFYFPALFAQFGKGRIRGKRPRGCHIATKVFEVTPNPDQRPGLKENVNFSAFLNHTLIFSPKYPNTANIVPILSFLHCKLQSFKRYLHKKNER